MSGANRAILVHLRSNIDALFRDLGYAKWREVDVGAHMPMGAACLPGEPTILQKGGKICCTCAVDIDGKEALIDFEVLQRDDGMHFCCYGTVLAPGGDFSEFRRLAKANIDRRLPSLLLGQ